MRMRNKREGVLAQRTSIRYTLDKRIAVFYMMGYCDSFFNNVVELSAVF